MAKDPSLKEKQSNTNKIGLVDKNANLTPDVVERQAPAGQKFIHNCSVCGKGMTEGYVVDSGMELYCSDECLNKLYSPKQWEAMAYGGEDEDGEPLVSDENYWTEWYDDEELFEPEED